MKNSVSFLLVALMMCCSLFAVADVAAPNSDGKTLEKPLAEGAYNSGSLQTMTQDSVFRVEQENGLLQVKYVWPTPAVVYQVSTRVGMNLNPGRTMCILKIKKGDEAVLKANGLENDVKPRSKAEVKAAMGCNVRKVNISAGQTIYQGTVMFEMVPQVISHDSVTPGNNVEIKPTEMFLKLWRDTGICEFIRQTQLEWTLGVGRIIMILVGLVLIYLAIIKGFEPLLLLPIGFGAVMSNIPLAGIAEPDGILGMLFNGVNWGIYPLLIFLGIGAMTDFGPLIANPITCLLGGAAQLGIFAALFGAVLISSLTPDSVINFSIKDAASIGIIGGADGPTAIFLSSRLSPNLLGSIAVAAYSYMALVPIIQPPIIKALTTKQERVIRMSQLRKVSKLEKIVFPIVITLLCCLLLPSAAPLISMLMLGNLLKESMCTDRLSDTAQNALINIVTIFLGLSVGSKLSADKFLNFETLGILLLGLVAFAVGTAGGVIMGKIMCKLSGGKINPMIGAAGVSAVPMAARVVNKIGLEEDPQNFLLMHAMGPNVSGVIGSAVAAGVLLCALGS
ncbi:MAG: sodium ion-translocating decarboxylase subunit beta [Victivallales bacterium]|nr:sodium ion-translocating decarboxylase subunit beta [Victivallales bacterium]